jgi:hypothetical protein
MTKLDQAREAIQAVREQGPGTILAALEALADAVEDATKPAQKAKAK